MTSVSSGAHTDMRHEQVNSTKSNADTSGAAPLFVTKTLDPSSEDTESAYVVDWSDAGWRASACNFLEKAACARCCEVVALPRYMHTETVIVNPKSKSDSRFGHETWVKLLPDLVTRPVKSARSQLRLGPNRPI